METNEQGLTKEEKIMFSILGIILIAAIGVLIINSFSSNERKLDDEKNNTPITETQGQKENIEDETITEEADDSLIEEIPVITAPVVEVESNTTSQNSTQNMNNSSNKPNNKPEIKDEVKDEPTVEDKEEIEDTENKNDNEENEGTGSTDPSLIKWSLKDTIITEAYTNDTITLDKYVILDDGSEEEATVEVKKQDGESWNSVDTSTNQFTVTEGIYKYLYTYNEETKELLLTVINKLELENISILTLAEQYNETASISEEDFNKLKHTITNTTLINDSNNYTLTITKDNNSSNLIPLVLTLNEETSIMFVASTINGLNPTVENAVWYQTLSNKDILLWIDLNQIDLSNSKMNININGTTYYFNLNIVVNIKEEDKPEIEDIPVEDTKDPTIPEDEVEPTTPTDKEESEEEKDTPKEDTPTEDSKVEEEDSQETTGPTEDTKEEEETKPTEDQIVEEEETEEEPSEKDEPLPEGNEEPTDENNQELNSEYEENAESETHNIIQNDVVETTPITS